MKKLILGIDTSNYTTSVAVMSYDGELLANIKRPLPVKKGERGLRQSDAVFSHIKNLPDALSEAREYIKDNKIVCIGVSDKPRNIEGSYMPCFLAGVSAASSASAATGAPLYKFSHQCGHIMAAVYSSGNFGLLEHDFAAFHISGGTTDLMRVSNVPSGFICELVGGSKDLNAGQVIDRIGVAMGLPFPSGVHLEALAKENVLKVPKKKISRDGLFLNLSGLENMAIKLFEELGDKALTASFVFDYLGNAIKELSEEYISLYGSSEFVYAGGVMCNSLIKNKLKGFSSNFAEPMMSADNAVGIAYLAKRSYIE